MVTAPIRLALLAEPQALSTRELPPRIPPPSHRHAAPSGPWPWMDLGLDFSPLQPPQPPGLVQRQHWKGYPQSLFPNWTPDQVERSKVLTTLAQSSGTCAIHHVDVLDDASFLNKGITMVPQGKEDEFWEKIEQKRPEGIRVRSLFVDNFSVPVLQMLGTKYNVEPFFFTSSVNWIPSRYQEEVQPGKGDHITIVLSFIRTMQNPTLDVSSRSSERPSPEAKSQPQQVDQVIDTQAPLFLRSSDDILLLDLLSLHMVRTPESSTIISYHPTAKWWTTSGKRLQALALAAGESVYWQKIFTKSNDPTFVLLAILWYALYAWDEALEVLYQHIGWLESRVMSTNDMQLVRELHIIQAHLLHYESLLQDFRKSVKFVLDTPNPVMVSPSYDVEKKRESEELMKKECNNLLSEIDRLECSRAMQGSRLKNVMHLAFATVNIEDSRDMRRLTEAAVRDSAAMKQISYLTMIFLPASFVSGVFGMNVREINPGTYGTLVHYIETTVALTALTVWIVVAFQRHSPFHASDSENLWIRLWWPFLYLSRRAVKREKTSQDVNV